MLGEYNLKVFFESSLEVFVGQFCTEFVRDGLMANDEQQMKTNAS